MAKAKINTVRARDLDRGQFFFFLNGSKKPRQVVRRHPGKMGVLDPGSARVFPVTLPSYDEVIPAEEGQSYEDALEAATERLTFEDLEPGDRFRCNLLNAVAMKLEPGFGRATDGYRADAVIVSEPTKSFYSGSLWMVSSREPVERVED